MIVDVRNTLYLHKAVLVFLINFTFSFSCESYDLVATATKFSRIHFWRSNNVASKRLFSTFVITHHYLR